MDKFLLFGIAMMVLAVFWFVGKVLQKRELQATQKTVSMKLKKGAPPEDVYPMW